MVPALIIYAVDSVRADGELFRPPGAALHHRHQTSGLLYVVSVASVGVYGIILAAGVDSKYPLLASLRASGSSSRTKSPVTLTLVRRDPHGRLAQHGRHRQRAVQQRRVVRVRAAGRLPDFLHRRSGGTNRAPFDLPEAEQELTGGFHTEYSGHAVRAVLPAEYANMIVVSSVATTLFLVDGCGRFQRRGARLPRLRAELGVFLIKSFMFLYIFIWVGRRCRATATTS